MGIPVWHVWLKPS